MNTIGRIQFDFTMRNEAFAQQLYAHWDGFFRDSFEKIADEVMAEYDHPSKQVVINNLNLDLGAIPEDELDEQFPLRFRGALEEALSNCITEHASPKNMVSTTVETNYFDLLTYFLLNGTLPWYTATEYRDVTRLFLFVLQKEPGRLKTFLMQYGHYTSLQQRLVYQLEDPELEQGVHLLRSAESPFISSYVRFLKKKYKAIKRSDINERNYRHAVWQVVYSWILTDRGSAFNRKSFLSQTIASLASRFNISYYRLLERLTDGIGELARKQVDRPELYQLLNSLREEADERLLNEVRFDSGKLKTLLSSILEKGVDGRSEQRALEWLIAMLSHSDSCRQLISRMTEKDIIGLMPSIVPGDSEFVIGYARSLDKQKESGALQGKAGGEFGKLKWMIIFPVLLSSRGSGFNRKEFVSRTLRGITAHYNLTVDELLRYFMQEALITTLSPVLRTLLETLFSERMKENPVASGKTLHTLLNQPARAFEYLQSLDEKKRYQLLDYFASADKQFVIDYARSLDRQQSQGMLEGKAGRDFQYVKWYFIFNVLAEPSGTAFNRRYFVRDVLKHIAARFNLGYIDLLRYFHTEKEQAQLPVALRNIFRELFVQEKHQMIELILRTGSESDKNRVLDLFIAAGDRSFVEAVIRLLDALYKESTSRFTQLNQRKWEIIYHLLREYTAGSIHRPTFLRKLTERLSTLYQTDRKEINKIVSTIIRRDNIPIQPDLKQLIMEIVDWTLPNEEESIGTPQWSYVKYAGVVLIASYLPRLFSMLKLTNTDFTFNNDEAKARAIFMVHYAVKGDSKLEEHESLFYKILIDYPENKPLPATLDLTQAEKETIDGMLKAVLGHWPKLNRSSIETLRQAFLEREGRIENMEDHYLLIVEEKAYDMLLDSIPWNYKIIKFAWMQKRMEVRWR